MAGVWSDARRYEIFTEVELLATEAWVKLGVVPKDDFDTIKAKAVAPTPERVAEIEEVTQHDVIAFLTALGEPIGPASRWIHYGMTSNDLLDTTLGVQLTTATDLIIARVETLLSSLKRRAFEFKDAVCVGRSHGIHAEPTTFGLKLAVYAFEVARDLERLRRAREAVAVGKVAGPVGTYASIDPAVEEHVCAGLGLTPAPAVTQVVQRDRIAELLSACAITASTCEKISVEIRHLQRTEVREAAEPFGKGQKGSSAMPHKKNPILCERITGLARLIRGYLNPALENNALWHERDISHSSVERVILPDATIALDYQLSLTIRVVDGMTVDTTRMRQNLDATHGLVYSAHILLALVEAGMSREDAYAAIQSAAMKTWDEGVHFRDTLLELDTVKAVTDAAKLDALMDPDRYLVHIDQIFKRLEAV
jgi:adenylosuccinate lyase